MSWRWFFNSLVFVVSCWVIAWSLGINVAEWGVLRSAVFVVALTFAIDAEAKW